MGGGGSIDVVDNLESTDTNKALSANQGKILNDTKLDKTNAIGRAGTGTGVEVFNVDTTASGSNSHAEGYMSRATTPMSHAEGYETQANGLASHSEGRTTIASGDHSHAEGEQTTASGESSHSEGYYTKAIGKGAHAEGYSDQIGTLDAWVYTTASGKAFHAEGYCTKAISTSSSSHGILTFAGAKCFNIKTFGTASTKTYTLDSVEGLEVGDVFSLHLKNEYDNQGKITEINTSTKTVTVDNFKEAETATEGNPVLNIFRIAAKPEVGTTDFAEAAFTEGCRTKAVAKYAHAEGVDTTVIGNNGHAEGRETVAVYAAHAEGERTKAMGYASHTEGYQTTANGSYQHVQGKYNIEDSDNKYAHIVGNGTSDTNRSNAYTVDWNGNAWFAGDVKIGGTSYDDTNAKTVATTDMLSNTGFQYFHISITLPDSSTDNKYLNWVKIGTISNFDSTHSIILTSSSYNFPYIICNIDTEFTLKMSGSGNAIGKITANGEIMVKVTSGTYAETQTISGSIVEYKGKYTDIIINEAN